MGQTLIEAYGITYSGGDVKVNLLGATLDGISKIKYGTKQKKENEYGMNREPLSRKLGRREYEATITVKSWAMDAFQRAAAASSPLGGDITQISPFPVVISYLDTDENLIKTDVLRFCEFTDDVREIKGDDTTIEQEVTLIVGGIERNV